MGRDRLRLDEIEKRLEEITPGPWCEGRLDVCQDIVHDIATLVKGGTPDGQP